MAFVKFKKLNHLINMPATITDGCIYFVKDAKKIFADFNSERTEFSISEAEVSSITEASINESFADLLAKLEAYNKSSEVNSFYYGEDKEWLDKNTRIGLQNLINCGADIITLQLKKELLDISAEELKLFLNKLEVYAGKCFATTAKHQQAINQLYTTEDLINYDYTANYPKKVRLR